MSLWVRVAAPMRETIFRIRMWMQWCKCGHPVDLHQHWRKGTDCGASGCSCRGFSFDFSELKRR